MRTSHIIIATTALLTLTACASKPESIAAAYISPTTYNNWSCQQLAAEARRIDAAYATAASQQEKARSNDIMSVILIGVPVSSLSGDNVAPQIANLKGIKQTIEQVQIKKNCLF